jgi:hypothetical protein
MSIQYSFHATVTKSGSSGRNTRFDYDGQFNPNSVGHGSPTPRPGVVTVPAHQEAVVSGQSPNAPAILRPRITNIWNVRLRGPTHESAFGGWEPHA